MNAGDSRGAARGEIDAFNKKFVELRLKMATPGDHGDVGRRWSGFEEAPMVGRKTITAWIENVLPKMPGYKVTKEEMVFHEIRVCGDGATEWATGPDLALVRENPG